MKKREYLWGCIPNKNSVGIFISRCSAHVVRFSEDIKTLRH